MESLAREQDTVALAKFLVFLGVVVEAAIPYPEALLGSEPGSKGLVLYSLKLPLPIK